MVKTTRKVVTYEISLHDLRDDLGIHAVKILDVKTVPEPKDIDSVAIVLTVEVDVEEDP